MNPLPKHIVRSTCIVMIAAFSALLPSSCTSIQLIPPYDDTINTELTQLQKDTETFIVAIERNSASKGETNAKSPYDKTHTDFFDSAKVSIALLTIRAQSISTNNQTVGELSLLGSEFTSFEKKDHDDGGVTVAQAIAEKETLDTLFRSLLTLEIAKKNETSSGTSK